MCKINQGQFTENFQSAMAGDSGVIEKMRDVAGKTPHPSAARVDASNNGARNCILENDFQKLLFTQILMWHGKKLYFQPFSQYLRLCSKSAAI